MTNENNEKVPLEDIAQEIIRAKNDEGFSRLDGNFQPLIDEVCEEFEIAPYQNTDDPEKDITSYLELRDYVRSYAESSYGQGEVCSFLKAYEDPRRAASI